MSMPNWNRGNNFGLDDELKYKHYKEFTERQKNKMTFKEYQERTLDTLITNKTNDLLKNNKDLLIARLALGVAGEGGEVAEKVKKYLRGDSAEIFLKVDLKKEIGDVLWYCSALAHVMGLDLGEIAKTNLAKLKSRRKRNKVKGSGDNR